jgi:hypothetical protein
LKDANPRNNASSNRNAPNTLKINILNEKVDDSPRHVKLNSYFIINIENISNKT